MAIQHRQIFWSILFTLLLFCVQALPAFRFFDSPASYVPMHIVLELLSIAVSIMVFSLAWNLRGLKQNSQPILLGAGFLAVSLIDLAHTLSFAGMPDLVTPSDPEKAINFWLAGRYVAALILLAVALLPRRHWGQLACHGFLAAALFLAGGVWWLGLFHPEWLPRFFIPGQGLTATKVGAEYLVAGLYGMTAILLFRAGYRTQNPDRLWLAAAAWIQGLAELFFTLYADVTDLFNLAGHVYKAIAYLAVYRALFVAGVQAPYRELESVADELRLAATTFESQEGILITDAKEVILRVNRAFTEITGYTLEDLRGKTPRILTSGRQDREFYVAMWQSIAQSGSWRGEVWNRRKNGVIYPEWLTITAVKGPNGAVTHYVANIIDITERKAAADQIEYLDFYDPLTRLPNRKLMFDRLGQVLRNCERRQRQGALILDRSGRLQNPQRYPGPCGW